MSTVYTKAKLSGSTDGKQILITATTGGGAQTIHTAVSGTTNLDEVWIYAYNEDTADATLTILWGGTTEPDNVMRFDVPPQAGRYLCVDGALLQNSLIVKAYASIASKIVVDGFVNQLT
jgi:hypothetical protein